MTGAPDTRAEAWPAGNEYGYRRRSRRRSLAEFMEDVRLDARPDLGALVATRKRLWSPDIWQAGREANFFFHAGFVGGGTSVIDRFYRRGGTLAQAEVWPDGDEYSLIGDFSRRTSLFVKGLEMTDRTPLQQGDQIIMQLVNDLIEPIEVPSPMRKKA